ncbi:uncharacterized protein KY384_002508 [Bacidia gigantensis]|uniref:uncharacterized protein n=1 Tax=Bacidia gigantensis TaxID=2732470 RepID=UPI001D03A2DF|nr:uncharacterized protein KY384_002508 [Bacidia gigantensis]KAG8532631.1 hypothetical protein KY384_002508 [Bacidia gigantensis]
MAEMSKRSGEVALGKVTVNATAGSQSLEQTLRASIGARVQVHTTNPHSSVLEGILYTACPQTSLLAVATGPASSPAYHIVPISSVNSFIIVAVSAGSQHLLSPGSVNTAAFTNRANVALGRAKERAAKINKSVEKVVQDLFDALDKQFSARWRGKDIIVMERVVVKAPGYKSEDCKVITKDGEGLLDRVRKVVG